MEQTEKNNIQKLLRLKRYEQPPPGYYEDFLREFQSRQRAEWLRKPAWRMFLSHLTERLAEFRVGTLAYASVIVVAGILSVYFLTQPASPSHSSVAFTAPLSTTPVVIPSNSNVPVSSPGKFSPKQYILESRPVSHEHPFEF